MVLLRTLVLSPLTPSQPGTDLSCNCRWQNSVGLNSLKSHRHSLPITYIPYVCMYVQYTYVYAFAKFFFYYEYSTLVFDLAIVWNLISDLIYDHFCEFCLCGRKWVFAMGWSFVIIVIWISCVTSNDGCKNRTKCKK